MTMKRLFLLIAFVFGFLLLAPAQAQAPLFETRAVWFATVLRDGGWPAFGSDPASQPEALRQRIRDAHQVGINTFIFQAVARGDALYPSQRLPWSEKPLGAGQDPGYDPLAVALEEAHRLGMEVHAWINVFRVSDASTLAAFEMVEDPAHVAYAHPGWVIAEGSNLWIDPSSPDARAWLIGNVLEVVENYDVDAVHFDFIRYPQGGLDGDGTRFQFDSRGFANIDDWRRDNVTQFVREVYPAILAVKPWVKVGSAPIGNYENNGMWPALWAFSDVFQESRRWLQDGVHDYLAPQIYFSIGTAPEGSNTFPSPDFDWLIQDWEAASNLRPIFAGMAAYKPSEGRFPAGDLPLQIDAARDAGAEGQVIFRYDHLMEHAALIGSRYPHPSLPAAMPHRFEAAAPSTPGNLALDFSESGAVFLATLMWTPSTGATSDPLRGYAVFRREGAPPDPAQAEDLFAVVDQSATVFIEEFASAPDAPVYYRVIALSKLGLPSGATEAVSTGMATAVASEVSLPSLRLDPVYPNPTRDEAVVTFEMDRGADVSLVVYDVLGRAVATLAQGRHAPGIHRVRLDGTTLSSGIYLCVLRTEAAQRVQQILIVR